MFYFESYCFNKAVDFPFCPSSFQHSDELVAGFNFKQTDQIVIHNFHCGGFISSLMLPAEPRYLFL